jgi:Domain of unknown function (DUF4193)
MMRAAHARRRVSLPDHASATRPSRDYDDDRLRAEDTPEEVLPGQNLASRWVDIDDADESDMERAFELAGADLAGEDITVPVIPKRADEFMCSSCFLICHMSRMASSRDGQPVCTDCA